MMVVSISRKIRANTIQDPNVLTVTISKIHAIVSSHLDLKADDVIYISTTAEETNEQVNVYADDGTIIILQGISTGSEYLGTVLGKAV